MKDNLSQPPEEVLLLLREQSTLSLATAYRSGAPHVAPLFYIPDERMHLYWFSKPDTRHCRDLAHQPAAAVTVFFPTRHWREIRGVQMRGTVSLVRDPARRAAIATAYSERFRLGHEFDAILSRHRLYEFRPSWVRYLSNEAEFGFKVEFRFPKRTRSTFAKPSRPG